MSHADRYNAIPEHNMYYIMVLSKIENKPKTVVCNINFLAL